MNNQNNCSRYALVIGVSKRARQITEECFNEKVIITEKPVLIAANEFKSNKLLIKEHNIND